MMYLHRFFAPFVLLVILISCESKTSVEHVGDVGFLDDSLAIARLFGEALAAPNQADSLLAAGQALGDKADALQETYLFYLSRFYIQTGKIAQADSTIDRVLAGYGEGADNYALGKFYNLKAATAAYQQQQEKSVSYHRQAMAIFDRHGDHKQLAAVQFNLANTFFSRLDFASAHKYILEAKANFEAVGDSTYLPLADGILAVVLTKVGDGAQSKALAEGALASSIRTVNPLGQILAHYALGDYRLSITDYGEAMEHYEEARQLSEQYRIPNLNLPIKAASLAALVNLGQYPEAAAVGREALALAKAMNNEDIQYSLNKNLAEALAQTGQEADAYQHLKAAEEIFRNNTVANNEETLQTLLIEYETEKKNNLILRQENHLAKQRLSIISLATLALVGAIGFFSYRRNVSQQREIEQHNKALEIAGALTQGEEKERVRLADELHDGIASNLVALRLQLETANGDPGNGESVALVKRTHTEVRKIAHNLMPIDFSKQDWQSALASFCADMSNSRTQVAFAGSEAPIRLPQDHALILYRCVQELVQNAVKHAGAGRVDVQALQSRQGLRITVEDDGNGFDVQEAARQGIALFKYKDRLAGIGATFDVDSSPGKGATVFIDYHG